MANGFSGKRGATVLLNVEAGRVQEAERASSPYTGDLYVTELGMRPKTVTNTSVPLASFPRIIADLTGTIILLQLTVYGEPGQRGQSAQLPAGMAPSGGTGPVKDPITWAKTVRAKITRPRFACPGYVQVRIEESGVEYLCGEGDFKRCF
ncbi:hypothetical protein ElyMa_001192300 [Elysia marginata]|uniref:Uncharacterized protein n=1 Tax=Elysia marginata TaxID=1093978 RepID=A0AAV4I3S8_9GAST|nr:hypothetical protein ElyMa_001192300 [Elysia marginata]